MATKGISSSANLTAELQERFAKGTLGTANAGTARVGGMHMNELPTGRSVSLSALVNGSGDAQDAPPNNADTDANAEVAKTAADGGAQLIALPGQGMVSSAALEVDWKSITDWTPYLNREVYLPLDMIVDSPYQHVRDAGKRYEPTGIAALGEGMSEGRQEESVQVRWTGKAFELIAGHRRSRGARESSWKYIRGMIRQLTDDEAKVAVTANNRGRIDDFDYVLGKQFKALFDDPVKKQSQRKIAALYITSQTVVSKCMQMLTLPKPIIAMLEVQPDLFGYNTSDTIRGLLTKYPDDEDLVVRAVERLREGKPENSISNWVEQMVAQRRAGMPERATEESVKERLVTNASGRPQYKVTSTGRSVRIKLENREIDGQALSDKIYAWLSQEQKDDAGK